MSACVAGLEGLCLEVAEAVFEEDEDKGGGAIMGSGNGGAAVDSGMDGPEDETGDWEGQWDEEEGWGDEVEDEEEHRIREIQVALLSETFPQCDPDR